MPGTGQRTDATRPLEPRVTRRSMVGASQNVPIVDAIADRNGKRAEKLVSDHLLRTLATINIWR
jgi:DNA-binding GntR family transcriptional regulator